jgi:glycosyltransferase involved in cell wall biosynthesis
MSTILHAVDMPSVNQARCTELWFLDHAPILGGAERFALKLAEAAAAREPPLRCVMVCPQASELADRSWAAGIEVRGASFPAVAPPSPRAPAAVLALRSLLANAPPTAVVIANTARAQAYVAATRLLPRQAPTVVNLAHEQETAARRVARAALRRGGALVTIGANAAAAYERALPGVRVHRINNVLNDLELSSAESAPARALRLAVLARMIPEKGILELLEEAALNSELWSTIAIGASPQDRHYEAVVEARIGELGLTGRVALHGNVRNVSGFLDAADVLVVPSTGGEGQPTAIIEALARGLPVLARESILSEDYGGLPVRGYRDAADFGEALAKLRPSLAPVADMRRRFGADQAIDGLLAAAC